MSRKSKSFQQIKERITQQFIQQVGYNPDIDNPKSFNEKIQWLKLYYRDPLLTKCSDKFLVRNYIKEKVGEKYLIPLIGVYDSVDQIDFKKLPNKFVLKTNNGSGRNIICKNKSKLDITKTKVQLREWMKPENCHYFYSYEWAYKNIKPKIICEKYLEQKNKELYDYQILCFHEEPKYIWVDTGRFTDHKRNFFDINWKEMSIKFNYHRDELLNIKKPNNLNEMLKLAKILSKDFPHVRVDLYTTEEKIFFGELTFYSEAGLGKVSPVEWDYKLGEYLDIKKITNQKIANYLSYKNTRKSKIIIYTAITGNYDNLIQHKHISMDFDYVCFTDQEIKNPGIWKIDKLKNIDIDDTRKARYHKIFPNKILSKYDYSVWIDANIDVLDDTLEKNIFNLMKENAHIGVVPHFERNCIYQEGKACIDFKKETSEVVFNQMAFLKKENYPKNNGLYETNILFRKHNEKLIFDTMDDWWQMVKKFSKRDQLSFNYVLWKNNLVPNMLLSKNARLTDSFDFRPHNITVTSTLYLDKTEVNDSDKFIQKSTTILNNNFEVNFEINISTKNDFVLFNLFKNYYAKIKIEKVIYDKNDTQLLNKVLVDTNGKLEEDGYFDFSSSNPIFVFKKPKSVEHISIIGKILPFSIETKNKQLENKYAELETTYSELAASHRELQIKSRELETKNSELESNINKINSLFSQQEFLKNKISNKKVEIFQLEKDLNKIKSAKFFKLWQGYNKIKKIF